MAFPFNPLNLCLVENIALRRRKRKWMHELNKERRTLGEFHHLYGDLREDEERFWSYFRMSKNTFDYIVSLISNRLQRQNTNFRMAIAVEEKLMVTIRYLATGMSFRSLSHSFRMGVTTVASCVHETCSAICEILGLLHLPFPTVSQLEEAAHEMFDKWNFSNCVGAVDGKHVRIQCPPDSGTMFFNYKKFFSICLLAVADANYKFITVDIGAYGKQSDGGTFRESDLYNKLLNVPDKWPKPKEIPGTSVHAPFVLVGDEAFPLLENLMRPFPGVSLTEKQRLYNRSLSRCRSIVERTFGILANKWRILRKEIETSLEHAEQIVQCMCILNNVVIDKDGQPTATLMELERGRGTTSIHSPHTSKMTDQTVVLQEELSIIEILLKPILLITDDVLS